jgi:hypothetical protein
MSQICGKTNTHRAHDALKESRATNIAEKAQASVSQIPPKDMACAQGGEEDAFKQKVQDVTVKKPELLEHIRMVTSLVEGRAVSMDEILSMLIEVMRQRSFAKKTKMDYILAVLNKKPP